MSGGKKKVLKKLEELQTRKEVLASESPYQSRDPMVAGLGSFWGNTS